MDKSIVKKYTIVGEDDYETKIYYYPFNMYIDNYYSIMAANVRPIKGRLEYDDTDAGNVIDIKIDIGQYPGYIVFTGEEYGDFGYSSIRLKNQERQIGSAFYE